jgi:hypothetical protein
MANNFSNSINKWLEEYSKIISERSTKAEGSTIEVSDAASKIAFIYEKIRNTVDYREEHLIRKHAIARMLKRLAAPGSKGSEIALPLIEEIIRARYLANKSVPESMVKDVRNAINKYIVVYNSAIDKNFPSDDLSKLFSWLLKMAACEVEEILLPAKEDKITIDAMHRIVRQNIILDDENELDETSRNIQIYISVLKSLIKADEMIIHYNLFKYYFPKWKELSLAQVEKKVLDLKHAKDQIETHYTNSLNEKLTKEFKRYAVVFWILQNIIEENPKTYNEIFASRDALVENIRKVCNAKYKLIGGRVRRAIIRSVIYIFLTKIIFGILLEFPYDYFVQKQIHWLSLSVNALFPPMLMTAIGLSIRTPKDSNTNAIIAEVDNIVFSSKGKEHRIKILKPKRGFGYYLLQVLYTILYLISFGLIIYGLAQLLFSYASMIIFLLFLTMVSFFSLRVRRTAAELIILEKKERFLTVLLTLLFVPILRVGRWISLHSSKINVFIFILDFIIESPFKIFVRIFEDLVIFIKQKRDEML